VGRSEPVVILVTGPPGTGKSFVTDSIRSLFDKLNWVHEEEYLFQGFQASTAVQIKGSEING
jgi:broad-specificity NMP kinase